MRSFSNFKMTHKLTNFFLTQCSLNFTVVHDRAPTGNVIVGWQSMNVNNFFYLKYISF